MLSEVRSRYTDMRSRLRPAESTTASDIRELQAVAETLRRRYGQILGDENASCSEACDLAADAMQYLRNELDCKRSRCDCLRVLLDEIRDELNRVENEYTREKELRESCRNDVVRMKHDTEKARKGIINLKSETRQKIYFQETVDSETKHRLMADIQNLETERERSAIKLRQLGKERDQLKSKLDELQVERDEVQLAVFKRKREFSEVNMTKEMYRAHQEALLRLLPNDPKNIYQAISTEKISNLFKGWYNVNKTRESDNNMSKEGPKENLNDAFHDPPGMCDRGKKDDSSIVDHFTGNVEPVSTSQAKSFVPGAEFDGSYNNRGKSPTIFKLGSGNDDYVPMHILEMRASIVSDITVDEIFLAQSESSPKDG